MSGNSFHSMRYHILPVIVSRTQPLKNADFALALFSFCHHFRSRKLVPDLDMTNLIVFAKFHDNTTCYLEMRTKLR